MKKLFFAISVLVLLLVPTSVGAMKKHAPAAKQDFYLSPGLSSFRAQITSTVIVSGSTPVSGTCTNGNNLYNNNGVVGCQANGGGGGTPGGTNGQIQFNSAGSFGGFTMSGDCTTVTSTGVITCTAINTKTVTLGGPLTTTGAGTTTLAFAAAGVTYTFPAGTATLLATNGNGSALTGFTYSQLPALSANQVLGALTATTPSGQSVPSCSTASSALTWTSGTGFGCNSISGSSTPVLGAPPYNTGNSIWYGNPLIQVTTTSQTGTANFIYCAPLWIYQNVTIKALGVRVIAASAGNTSKALAGAIYNNLLRTDGTNRPGTFIDFTTTPFATGVGTSVSSTLNNTTDALTGPGLYWECVQIFDSTITFSSINSSLNNGLIEATIGSTALASVVGSGALTGVRYSGASAFNTVGATGWATFDSTTTWAEAIGNNWSPVMAFQVN